MLSEFRLKRNMTWRQRHAHVARQYRATCSFGGIILTSHSETSLNSISLLPNKTLSGKPGELWNQTSQQSSDLHLCPAVKKAGLPTCFYYKD